jgi:hypothetical protein
MVLISRQIKHAEYNIIDVGHENSIENVDMKIPKQETTCKT